jgi:hypothetical protein
MWAVHRPCVRFQWTHRTELAIEAAAQIGFVSSNQVKPNEHSQKINYNLTIGSACTRCVVCGLCEGSPASWFSRLLGAGTDTSARRSLRGIVGISRDIQRRIYRHEFLELPTCLLDYAVLSADYDTHAA